MQQALPLQPEGDPASGPAADPPAGLSLIALSHDHTRLHERFEGGRTSGADPSVPVVLVVRQGPSAGAAAYRPLAHRQPEHAEDLLQTALTKTYVAWERIEDHRALDGYVRRALLNTRTSQWRKRKVDEFACEELPEPDPVPGGDDPAEQQALRDAMWRAIMRLPARQRAMVVLRYYEDLSEVQTAEVLGVSVGTVKSAVSRALGKLREDAELGLVRQ